MKLLTTLAAAALLAGLCAPALAANTASKVFSSSESSSPEVNPAPSPDPNPAPAPDDASSAAMPDASSATQPDNPSSSAEDAQASGPVVTARAPQTVLDELSQLGYPGKLGKMDSGNTSISVRIAGLNTYIDFYDCDDDLTNCDTLLFNVPLNIKGGTTPGKANDWNSKQIVGRVWLDDNAEPTLDFNVSTFEGVSPSVFDETVRSWADAIEEFKNSF